MNVQNEIIEEFINCSELKKVIEGSISNFVLQNILTKYCKDDFVKARLIKVIIENLQVITESHGIQQKWCENILPNCLHSIRSFDTSDIEVSLSKTWQHIQEGNKKKTKKGNEGNLIKI